MEFENAFSGPCANENEKAESAENTRNSAIYYQQGRKRGDQFVLLVKSYFPARAEGKTVRFYAPF